MKKHIMWFAASCAVVVLVWMGCDSPTSSGGKNEGGIPATFISLTANGSDGTFTTTKLILNFNIDIDGLIAGDISLTANYTGAVKGNLNRIDVGIYELELSGIYASGNVGVSVAKTGYAISGNTKQVQVFYSLFIQVLFNSLTANGSEMETTTTLTLEFDKDIDGLSAGDIIFDGGFTGATRGALIKLAGTGVYELALNGIYSDGYVSMSVSKQGYNISEDYKQVYVYFSDPYLVLFLSADANGSFTETTTKLTLTFNKDVIDLTADDITIYSGYGTWGDKEILTKIETGVYELSLSSVVWSQTVSVYVSKPGYTINGSPMQAMLHYYDPFSVTIVSVTANGSESEMTTKLTITFDKDIANLIADDINIYAWEGVEVNKGDLTRTALGIYELEILNVSGGDGYIYVSPEKDDYSIWPYSREVMVYMGPRGELGLTITYAQITDNAPSITGPTLYRVSNGGPTSSILTVENPEQYTSISWRVQNTAITGIGSSFTLNASNSAYNLIGLHFITVTVWYNNFPYSKAISFRVEY
ncbi:MAG: hypothetical protein FWG99_01035 [Treponema sp.]|nr:hypothetical protein [Treponema sp.]